MEKRPAEDLQDGAKRQKIEGASTTTTTTTTTTAGGAKKVVIISTVTKKGPAAPPSSSATAEAAAVNSSITPAASSGAISEHARPIATPAAVSAAPASSVSLAANAASILSSAEQKKQELLQRIQASMANTLGKTLAAAKLQGVTGTGQTVPVVPVAGASRTESQAEESESRPRGGLSSMTHPSLRVNEATGQIDIMATLENIPRRTFATAMANQRKEPVKKAPLKIERPQMETDPSKNPYFDPHIGVPGKKDRIARALQFHEKGVFERQASEMRTKAMVARLQDEIAASVKKSGLELDVGHRLKNEIIPEVEWWDEQFLPNKSYDDVDKHQLLLDVVTIYVQHPVELDPPTEKPEAEPKPLHLTEKERKKMRRQRRLEAEREKRDMIAQGLLPKEQPKVTIKNIMRVLKDEAVQDPTKIEAEVRKQMNDRLEAHLEHNLEKKLTPEERKAKKHRKLTEDKSLQVHVAVFRIKNLSNPSHTFKIDINAQQNQLSGVAVLFESCNVVVVEGGPKAIKRYKALMLRRIDWNAENAEKPDEDDMQVETSGADAVSKSTSAGPNSCHVVWEGVQLRPAFSQFRIHRCSLESRAKDIFQRAGVPNLWDLAWNFVAA